MKTIIVATDYSADASNAVEYAAALCQQMNARLILFNSFVIPPHAANSLLPSSAFQHLIDMNKGVLKSISGLLARSFSIEVLYESNISDIKEELDILVKKYDAGMVIMGMSGNSMEQKLFGNTTISVMKHASYPVMAIPRKMSFKGIKKIVFACDYTCAFIETTLTTLKSIFEDLHAQVEVFFVQSTPLTQVETDNPASLSHPGELDHLVNDDHVEFKTTRGIHIIKSIRDEVRASEADLLVMVPQKYKFWDSILHVSRTVSMASQSEVPLLSVPNRL